MATFRNERFTNQEIRTDGNRYEACVFSDCILVYTGGTMPSFVGCTFRQVRIQLDGAAFNTTRYLNILYNAGLTVATDKVLDGLQSGTLALPQRPSPPPSQYLGNNYGRLGLYSVILVVVTVLLGTALWYGYLAYPQSVLAESDVVRPLVETPLLRNMPVLPDALAETYDALNAQQIELITTYEIIDSETGAVRIPVDTAMDLLAEEGLPARPAEGN